LLKRLTWRRRSFCDFLRNGQLAVGDAARRPEFMDTAAWKAYSDTLPNSEANSAACAPPKVAGDGRMGYVDKSLGSGEHVRYRAKLHWIVYRPVLGILLFGMICFMVISSEPEGAKYAVLALVIAGLTAPVAFVQAWMERRTTEIAVTNRRVIVKVGLIRRTTMEMNANKIESMVINQSVLGRLLGYGTVLVKGTGAGIEPVSNVASPMKLRAAVTHMSDPAAA
jgi:hypothetical protein